MMTALWVFCILIYYLPLAYPIHFNIPRFGPNQPNVLYQGDAKPGVGTVQFNRIRYRFQVGRVISAERVRLWDADTKQLSDFTTNFSFTIHTLDRDHYAAGFAFFLAPVGFQIPPNSGGGFLGLFNTTTLYSPQNQIVLVEFDSFYNSDWDPQGEYFH